MNESVDREPMELDANYNAAPLLTAVLLATGTTRTKLMAANRLSRARGIPQHDLTLLKPVSILGTLPGIDKR